MLRRAEAKEYIKVSLKKSPKGWHNGWFYIKNVTLGLSAFRNAPAEVTDVWKAKVTAEEKNEVRPLPQKIRRLRDEGLNGAAVIATFVRRRVQLLRLRAFPMNSYEGKNDVTREVVGTELSDWEVI